MKNNKISFLKKGAGLGLCAVLAGGLMAGIPAFAQTDSRTAAAETKLVQTAMEERTAVKGGMDVSDIAEEALPSIVTITTKSIQEVQSYYGLFGYYGGYAPQQREVEGSGSGIIVGKNDTELLIATNYHVVEGAETLSVAFIDNEAYEGKVKGTDEDRDLAIVSVPLDDLSDDTISAISVAKIGSSDDLRVGEQVVAIGNALGYGQSVTTGIVSAKNRREDTATGGMTSDSTRSDGVNLIQTDAAINPGNSGGALLNMNGEVVGINSAKMASTAVEGMGYAIAISDVTEELQMLMNEESRDRLEDDEHGVLGISGMTVSDVDAQKYGFPTGVYVAEVTKGGGAEAAGIVPKSVITEFNGRGLKSIEKLIDYLTYYAPGEEVTLTVQVPSGGDYEEKQVTVVLGEQEKKETSKDSDDDRKDPEDRKDPGTPDGEDNNTDEYGDYYGDGYDDDYSDYYWNGDERSRDDIFEEWGNGLFEDFFR